MATGEETKAMIAVMQAYVDGAEIEARTFGANNWLKVEPAWNWDDCQYRVREPKWRPATMDDVGKRARFRNNGVAWTYGVLQWKLLIDGKLRFIMQSNRLEYEFCEVKE